MKAVANLREHERSPDGIFQLIAGKIRTKIFPKFGHHMSSNPGHLNSVPNYFFIAKKSNKKSTSKEQNVHTGNDRVRPDQIKGTSCKEISIEPV